MTYWNQKGLLERKSFLRGIFVFKRKGLLESKRVHKTFPFIELQDFVQYCDITGDTLER